MSDEKINATNVIEVTGDDGQTHEGKQDIMDNIKRLTEINEKVAKHVQYIEDHKDELEERINSIFEDVKNEYYRPPISGPDLIWEFVQESGKGTAYFDFMESRIGANVPFLLLLEEYQDFESVTRGLFAHEFGHYKNHPMNLSLSLYLSYWAQKTFGDYGSQIYPLYTDFQDNTIIELQTNFEENLKDLLRSTWEISSKDAVSSALMEGYNHFFKELNINTDLDRFEPEMREKIDEAIVTLKDFTRTSSQDYGMQYALLRSFGKAIKPLMPKPKENWVKSCESSGQSGSGKTRPCPDKGGPDCSGTCGGKGTQSGQGSGSGNPMDDLLNGKGGGSSMITPEDINNLPQHKRQKVKEAIQELVKKLNRGIYEDVKDHFLGKDKEEKNDSSKGVGIGLDPTDSVGLADQKTIAYYTDCARAFGIYVRPRRTLSISSVDIPFGKREFRPSDQTMGIDMRFSGGKILPGLTQITRKEPIPFPATREIIPRLVIYKDASGSMRNPIQEKCYGTIAGCVLALSYLRSGGEVNIAVFDAATTELFTSRKEEELLALLCGYKGGGTVVDMEALKKDLEG
ncbi:hypothetical protein HON01_05065, partial [Candidatus Woesearchaeota archaeon]|nr:hypothetical protein [Candidatus Woesearchaeota archaeon]